MQLGQPGETVLWTARTVVIILEHMENSLLTRSLSQPRTENYAISNIPLKMTRYFILYSDNSLQYDFKGCAKSLRSNNRIPLCSREHVSPVTPSCNKYYNNWRDSEYCEQKEKPYLHSSAILTFITAHKAAPILQDIMTNGLNYIVLVIIVIRVINHYYLCMHYFYCVYIINM